jgi:uncharacterized protein (DUF1697 family)
LIQKSVITQWNGSDLYFLRPMKKATMPRYFAFLRAVNVGGRTIVMARLRTLFESMGFSGVETFIASGNVVFDSTIKEPKRLEEKIARCLKETLGFDVPVFVRTESELKKISAHQTFPPNVLSQAQALTIAFLSERPTAKQREKLRDMTSPIDEFAVHGREMYWLCRVKQSDSKFSNAVFEKTIDIGATFRSMNTIQKMAAKYCREG